MFNLHSNNPNDQTSLPDIILNKEGLYPGNLRDYFRKIWESGSSANPYHNFRHSGHVAWEGYDAAKFEKIKGQDLRILLIALLNHDGDHSPNIGYDHIEIENAIDFLRKVILPEDEPYFEEIQSLIRATEYPYKPSGDLTLAQRIMRDADMSQTFSPVWLQDILFGLAREAKMSPNAMLFKQMTHVQSIQFHTTWGKRKFDAKRIASRVDEVMAYIDALGLKQDYLTSIGL